MTSECNKTMVTASDNCVCGLPKGDHPRAQAASERTASLGAAFVATTGRHAGGEWNSVILESYHKASLSRLDHWWQAKHAETAAQRDELLAEMREIARSDSFRDGTSVRELQDIARAAIARAEAAKGGAK